MRRGGRGRRWQQELGIVREHRVILGRIILNVNLVLFLVLVVRAHWRRRRGVVFFTQLLLLVLHEELILNVEEVLGGDGREQLGGGHVAGFQGTVLRRLTGTGLVVHAVQFAL